MKFILLETEIDFSEKDKTLIVSFLNFDWPDGNTTLFEIGFYYGHFIFNFCFAWAIHHRLWPWIKDKIINTYFHKCHFDVEVVGSWEPTGQKTVNWGLRIVPQYSTIEKCSCGKTRKKFWISLAD